MAAGKGPGVRPLSQGRRVHPQLFEGHLLYLSRPLRSHLQSVGVDTDLPYEVLRGSADVCGYHLLRYFPSYLCGPEFHRSESGGLSWRHLQVSLAEGSARAPSHSSLILTSLTTLVTLPSKCHRQVLYVRVREVPWTMLECHCSVCDGDLQHYL